MNSSFFIVESQIDAGKTGAIDVVLDVMKAHISSPCVCENGCGVLKTIALDCKKNILLKRGGLIIQNNVIVDNAVKAGQSGAIGMIVSAIKRHISNPGVCEQGCKALINIAVNGNSNK